MAFEKIKISGRIKLFILFILQFPPTGRGNFGGFQSRDALFSRQAFT